MWGLTLKAALRLSRKRSWTLLSLLLLVPLGLYTKFYSGPGATWVNNSLGGVFYEIFWCLLVLFIFDGGKPWVIATVVLVITCFLEFLQLWHHPFLELLRSYFIGRTIFGISFSWSDFPCYFLGSGIGWLWMRQLQSIGNRAYKHGQVD